MKQFKRNRLCARAKQSLCITGTNMVNIHFGDFNVSFWSGMIWFKMQSHMSILFRPRQMSYRMYCNDFIFTECPKGYYGDDCKKECGYCTDLTQCNHVNGTCLDGCEAGYKGEHCIQRMFKKIVDILSFLLISVYKLLYIWICMKVFNWM